jgi:hypothetical protein
MRVCRTLRVGGAAMLLSGLVLAVALPAGVAGAQASSPPASWTVVSSPNVSPTSSDALTSVSCPTASFCAAVGGSSGPLIEINQGTGWSISNAADTNPPSLGGLAGVSCSSATFCMAVGYANVTPPPSFGTFEVPAAEIWNGLTWQLIPVPDNGPQAAYRTDVLNSVSCVSPSFCAATGITTTRGAGEIASTTPDGYVEIWNGSTWSMTDIGGETNDVSCTSTTFCAAVGTEGGAELTGLGFSLGPFGGPAYVDTYNGSTWALTTLPLPEGQICGGSTCVNSPPPCEPLPPDGPTPACFTGATLTAVSCTQSWCLATGTQQVSTFTVPSGCAEYPECVTIGESSTVITANNVGTSWSTTAVPPPSVSPNGVACVAAGDCVGVGGGTVVQQLVDNVWSTAPNPLPSGSGTFDSVSCGTVATCTAVGNQTVSGLSRTLIAIGPSGLEALAKCGSSLAGCNLSGVKLEDATLAGVNAARANLSGANLSGASLAGASLAGANLNSATLKGVDLVGAGLVGANLNRADLSSANLSRANLTGANLTGANLTGVTWSGTTCPDGTNSDADADSCLGHL